MEIETKINVILMIAGFFFITRIAAFVYSFYITVSAGLNEKQAIKKYEETLKPCKHCLKRTGSMCSGCKSPVCMPCYPEHDKLKCKIDESEEYEKLLSKSKRLIDKSSKKGR